MTETIRARAMGRPLERLDGRDKVVGQAPYAYEQQVTDPLYLHPVQAVIARGRINAIDTADAESLPGVVTVLTHLNAPRLTGDGDGDDRELWVLQSDEVHFRGQFIGVVVAETSEIARHAADLVRVEYERWPHDVELSADRDDLYAPDKVNAGHDTDTDVGDVAAALADAPVVVDHTYRTPMEYNNPMEPHATVAVWDAGGLTMYDSTQGVHVVRQRLAPLFGLDPGHVRVVAPHVGGGFGSKGAPHAHNVLAGLAAQVTGGRPVKLAVTRQQMFSVVGHRTPTIQRIGLGAETDGRLTALVHEVVEHTSRIVEYAEQTAVVSRMMYAAPNRRTRHRLAALDVPVPFWMRAPGEAPGAFALEVAMDELAVACGLDPVELRIRNEPDVDPESGRPFSGRRMSECLREGARRFGWESRDPTPAARLRDGWLEGTGVAASVYPRIMQTGNRAWVRYGPDGRYEVGIGAVDIGTGTWTALTQIAADALEVPVEEVRLRIGDTDLPEAAVAGGSGGLSAWGSAVVGAARAFREKFGRHPSAGDEATGTAPESPAAEDFSMYSFGAQFAHVRVHADTGEIRVPRMLGVFTVGRVVNPRTARSQFVGAMTMGLSMALHEEAVLDPRFGHVVNHDLATYHIATHADVQDVDAIWLDEEDPRSNPMGIRGIGEIGIVGAAAAVANAVHHATGVRVRDLPITPDKLFH